MEASDVCRTRNVVRIAISLMDMAVLTEGEKADLEGIAAMKEYKEQGNRFVKMGRKHYGAAVDCYTKANAQMDALSNPDASVLFANRAHVNLLLGNNRRALDDARQAVRLYPSNVKAHYRAAKAAIALGLLPEAASFCRRGLEQDLANEELKKFLAQVEAQQGEQDRQRAKVAQAVSAAMDLAAAIDKRSLRLGKAEYQEVTGVKKPKLDEQGVLHWPVLLLYLEVMASDLIEDFPETDMFSHQLDVMFSATSPPLPWDVSHDYTREAIELYRRAEEGTPLSKSEILKYLLEGTVDSNSLLENLDGEDGEHDTGKGSTVTPSRKGSGKWIKVEEGETLEDVLQHKDYIILGIPVFLVVSRKSTSFYSDFVKTGKVKLRMV